MSATPGFKVVASMKKAEEELDDETDICLPCIRDGGGGGGPPHGIPDPPGPHGIPYMLVGAFVGGGVGEGVCACFGTPSTEQTPADPRVNHSSTRSN